MTEMALEAQRATAFDLLTRGNTDLGWYQGLIAQQRPGMPGAVRFDHTFFGAPGCIKGMVLKGCHQRTREKRIGLVI
jgi:hypothetical protein